MKELKRRIRSELSCVNTVFLLIMAGACVLLGVLFAVSGVSGFVYWHTFQPKFGLPPFFMVLFWILAYALYGASSAVALCAPRCQSQAARKRIAILSACLLVLCYVWIPVVYKAASFFLATLLIAVIILCLAVLYSIFRRISCLASWGLLIFAVWMLYILYYTFALFLLN